MMYFASISKAIHYVHLRFKQDCVLVPAGNWQSKDVSNKPEMATYEMMNVSFIAGIEDNTSSYLAEQTQCNMNWAEDHFEERVNGEPLNPGTEWKNWPWGNSAARFLNPSGQFNHNYMERYWPRFAGQTLDGKHPGTEAFENLGIRNRYGDLLDVVKLLHRDPLTRQAFIPIFFPEDTGVHHHGRVPCTLGYHLMRRNDQLHISYYIRSCDLLRHFRDDIYLTGRLLFWFLERLRGLDEEWHKVAPGTFTMVINSLHCFRADWQLLFNEYENPRQARINEYHERPRRINREPTGD